MQQTFSTRRTQMGSSSYNIPSQADNRILICKFHPGNDLHTFCLSPDCMLPMCSMCISMHNQDHKEMKSYGNYVSLYQLICDSVQILQECSNGLEQLSNQYVENYNEKKKIPQICRQTLQKARIKAHEELDRIFDRFVLGMQQKLGSFDENLHELYMHLQSKIHSFYRNINKQKQDLKRTFDNNLSMTKRTNTYGLTPRMSTTSFQFSKQDQSQQNRKDDHKILKTLIEFYSNNENEIISQKILKLRQEIKQLRQIYFGIDVDFMKLQKNLKNVCENSIEIRDNGCQPNYEYRSSQSSITSLQNKKSVKSNKNGGVSLIKPNNSQTQLMEKKEKGEIAQIMKSTNERMKKLQIDNKKLDNEGYMKQSVQFPVKDKHITNINQYFSGGF